MDAMDSTFEAFQAGKIAQEEAIGGCAKLYKKALALPNGEMLGSLLLSSLALKNPKFRDAVIQMAKLQRIGDIIDGEVV